MGRSRFSPGSGNHPLFSYLHNLLPVLAIALVFIQPPAAHAKVVGLEIFHDLQGRSLQDNTNAPAQLPESSSAGAPVSVSSQVDVVPAPTNNKTLLNAELKVEQDYPAFPLFGSFGNPLLPSANLPISEALNIVEAVANPQRTQTDGDNSTLLLSSLLPASKLSCACGKTQEYRLKPGTVSNPDEDEKIVNGEAAYIRDLPWTVGLIRKSTTGFGGTTFPFCGGTLINSNYILTASHCVDGQSASGIQVLVNEQDLLTSTEAKTMKVDVDQIIMHENYNKQTIDNDIALIRLAQKIDISSVNVITRPACISASSNDFAGVTATVAGFGATSQGSATSNILRKVDVPIMSNSDCNTKTNYNGKITENMMCAGLLEGGKDSCQGDSGGPLIALYGGRKTLVGIVSWGYGCAQALSPGVYTRVSRYSSWILSKTRGGEWCEG